MSASPGHFANDLQVLLIDDDLHLRQAASQALELGGLRVQALAGAGEVAAQLHRDWPGVIVCDIRMPGMDGMTLLRQVMALDPDLPVILITGHGDVPLAVEAMRAGAYDFIEKPFASGLLLDVVRRALEKRRLVLDNRSLRLALAERHQLGARLLGSSAAMSRLREQILALATTGADVLIHGETGTGKEVVARALHDFSNRRDGPFVAINCGALMESVAESELFGHEAGAFTGAQRRRIGKFEYASGGTVFLDEIESMSLEMQVKLLRLLQERKLERLGSNQLIALDIRVIAATKEDLRAAAERGRFRADLYYRLNVLSLRIPPLRNRGEDALQLFQHFAENAAQRYGLAPRRLDGAQTAAILTYGWPGNVRELQNAAERFALGLGLELPEAGAMPAPSADGAPLPLPQRVEAYERALLSEALRQPHGSLQQLADNLGLPRKTLYDKLRKYGLERPGEAGGNPPDTDD
ncbi:MAG TPA: sigma-54 dependent transcriptional regulator [Candidatus Competibacteraceae bacterium]|nr:sigma-54 dependent transcriptional regulator [Candidatus Competibacteraceae bacterium]